MGSFSFFSTWNNVMLESTRNIETAPVRLHNTFQSTQGRYCQVVACVRQVLRLLIVSCVQEGKPPATQEALAMIAMSVRHHQSK